MPERLEESLRQTSKRLRALQAVLRLKILTALREGGLYQVSVLSQELRVSQPLLSWHLAELRRVGFVAAERSGREVYYRLCEAGIRELLLELAALLDPALYPTENSIMEESKDGE